MVMIDSNLISLADFNEIVYPSKERTYLGTYNLTNGFAIYLTDGHNSCLTHTLNDYDTLFPEMLKTIRTNNPLVIIYYGYQTSTLHLQLFKEYLAELSSYHFHIAEINITDYFNIDHQGSEFAIDTRTKEIQPIDYIEVKKTIERENKHGKY